MKSKIAPPGVMVFSGKERRAAKTRLVKGPAMAVNARPFSPPLMRETLIGTGLAAIIIPPPNIRLIKGRAIVRIGSIWRSGFSEILPCEWAKSSPSL